MGFFLNLLTGGAGIAGANNAHLAELVIRRITVADKKRVAEKIISMGVQASRMTAEQFCDHFNKSERLKQLNAIALALSELYLDANLPGEVWLEVTNPFAIPTNSDDLNANANYFRRKHDIMVSVGNERIDIWTWLNPK